MIGVIESIDRALAILQYFLRTEEPLSVTQISKALGIHKSTVSRTIDTLEGRGFLAKDEETGKYWLGMQVYSLGMLYREQDSFQKIAYPYAKALAMECGTSVHMTTFPQTEAPYPEHVILEKITLPQTIDMAPHVGAIRPAYCSASGKCLLAFSDSYRKPYVGCKLKKFTEYTITDWPKLLAELDRIHQDGYAVERQEVELGMICIAAPIFAGAKIVAAISVSGPISRITAEVEKKYIAAVKGAAHDITQALS